MKCKDVHNELIFLTEGSINESKKAQIENHISNCEACNELYKNISEAYNSIDNEKITEINPFLFTRIEQKIKKQKYKNTTSNALYLKKIVEPLLFAAVVAIGLFLGILIGNSSSSQTEFAQVEDEFAQEFYFDNNELAYQSIEDYLIENE